MAKPEIPASLSDRAKEIWRQVCGHLEELGVLSDVDAMPIARYCEDYALWLDCQAHVEQYGVMYPLKADDGVTIKCLMPYPQVAQRARLDKQLKEFEREFGFSPAARKRNKLKADKAACAERKANKLKTLKIVRPA
jgi:P27 family predicted phage terminase small subunit